MVDNAALILDLTPEDRQRIEEQARQRGFDDPEDYLMALVEWDADEGLDEDPEASFRKALHEVMTGQTYPISTLWDFLDDE